MTRKRYAYYEEIGRSSTTAHIPAKPISKAPASGGIYTDQNAGISFEVPIRTGRGQNDRGNWKARHFGTRANERGLVQLAVKAYQPAAGVRLDALLQAMAREPVTVTLTRVAPGRSKGLDGDNLRGAMKNIRDVLAEVMGLTNDRESERLEWKYAQARGPWGVRVEVSARKPEVQGPGWTAEDWCEVARALNADYYRWEAAGHREQECWSRRLAEQAEAMARALGGEA